jgi:hypothetical protein
LEVLFHLGEADIGCAGSLAVGNVIGLVIRSFFCYECGGGGGKYGKAVIIYTQHKPWNAPKASIMRR